MEHRKHLIYLIMLCTLGTVGAHTPEEITTMSQDFVQPVQFRLAGIQDFFLHRFNNRFYAENFLPICFLHVEDFFDYGLLSKDPRVLALVTLDLFHQKLKEARWVNPFALSMLLQRLPHTLGSLCVDETEDQKAKVKKLILENIETQFDSFKNDPDAFVTSLADMVVDEIINPSIPTAREISEMSVRFMESALDKLIWDPRDQEYTWESVKLIGHQLEVLYEHNIIMYEKDLNHLLWSLIARFCYFLEMAGNELLPGCYYMMKEDIARSETTVPFLLKEELEVYSLTKKDRLMEAVVAAEIAAKLEHAPLAHSTINTTIQIS